MKSYRLILAVCYILLTVNCGDQSPEEVIFQTLSECQEVNNNHLAEFPYVLKEKHLLMPGDIDSSVDIVVLGYCSDTTTSGVTAFNWSGEQLWVSNSALSEYAGGVCIDEYRDRILYSFPGAIQVLDPTTGDANGLLDISNLSDILMLPELPGQYVPDIKLAQGIETQVETLLFNMHESDLRASYCGFLTDLSFSFQRYLRITKIEDEWYIGMTEGHDEQICLYRVPSLNHTLRPKVFDLALTDTSVVAILSHRDLVMEFAFAGELIRTTHFNHELEGSIEFVCDRPLASTLRYLIADVETDNDGYIYILYSGYGVGQNYNAEIWRIDTINGLAFRTCLNHSAVAFTVSGNKTAVIEQQHETNEEGQDVLIATPTIHLYEINWTD